jgi:hypothetical protein
MHEWFYINADNNRENQNALNIVSSVYSAKARGAIMSERRSADMAVDLCYARFEEWLWKRAESSVVKVQVFHFSMISPMLRRRLFRLASSSVSSGSSDNLRLCTLPGAVVISLASRDDVADPGWVCGSVIK